VAWIVEGLIRIVAAGKFSAFLSNTFQLQINTLTTITTFLLVALSTTGPSAGPR
jgi:low affinity Fe/Cu permease